MSRKVYALIVLFIFVAISSRTVYAFSENDEIDVLTLTKEQAINVAIENSNNLKKKDLSTSKAVREFEEAKDKSSSAEEMLDNLERYKYLYKKVNDIKENELYKKYEEYCEKNSQLEQAKEQLLALKDNSEALEEMHELESKIDVLQQEVDLLKFTDEEQQEFNKIYLTSDEQVEINKYRGIFGEVPPDYTEEEMFNKFIKNRDFYWYSAQGEIQKVIMEKEKLKNTIECNVSSIWNKIVQKNYEVKSKEELYTNQEREIKEAGLKFENGQVSYLEKYTLENQLKKLKLQIDNVVKDRENLEIELKKVIGLELDRNIRLEFNDEETKEASQFDAYFDNALKNRLEIKTGNIDLDIKDREFNITKEYIDEDEDAYKEAEDSLYEQQTSLDNTKKEIEKQLYTTYLNVSENKLDLNLKYKNLNKASEDIKAANNKYENGLISLKELWNLQYAKNDAEIQYEISKLNYIESLYELEISSGIGY